MEAESNEPALLLPAAGCPSAASAAVYQESRMRRYSTAHPSSKSTRKCEARRRLVATIVRLHTLVCQSTIQKRRTLQIL